MDAVRNRTAIGQCVNVAAKQLDSDTLIDDVRSALEVSGLDPRRLILEITESDMMRSPELALVTLIALKSLGVKLAIDDFDVHRLGE